MLTKNRLTVLVALAFVVSALATQVSAASAASYNQARKYVHFPPLDDDGGCSERDITFAAGTYRWRVYSSHWAHADRPHQVFRRLHLRRGTYSWWNCWGPSHDVNNRYEHYSYLHIWAGGEAWLKGDYQDGHYGDGSYAWRSTLQRLGG